MGCLIANITMLNMPPVLSVDRIGDGIVVNTYLAMERMAIKAFDAIIHPIMRCTVVCSIADLHYLKVSPEEVQWITPDYGVVYHVESDTNWIVTTNLI